MTDQNNDDITALLLMLSKVRPPAPAKRREQFLQLYHRIQGVIDMDNLPEADYEKLFNGLTTACGFDDPMDALEALTEKERNSRSPL